MQNPKNITIGHLNVNSLRNKFEAAETFPNQQLNDKWSHVTPKRQKLLWWRLFMLINENIPSKTINVEGIEKDCEIVLIEFSVKARKW